MKFQNQMITAMHIIEGGLSYSSITSLKEKKRHQFNRQVNYSRGIVRPSEFGPDRIKTITQRWRLQEYAIN
jgi:hypothetical protein